MMAGIKTRGTIAEQKVWKAMQEAEFSFALDQVIESKRPDITVEQYKTVILVHGCFWHAHNCYRFKWPAQNSEYWRDHLGKNTERDQRNLMAYQKGGWRVLTIWECALVGKEKLSSQLLIQRMERFFNSKRKTGVIG